MTNTANANGVGASVCQVFGKLYTIIASFDLHSTMSWVLFLFMNEKTEAETFTDLLMVTWLVIKKQELKSSLA